MIYRQHNTPELIQTYFENAMDKFSALRSNKPIYVMGDFNINLLKVLTCKYNCPVKNELIFTPTEIPNIFSKHLSSVGEKLASKMLSSSKHFSQYPNSSNVS